MSLLRLKYQTFAAEPLEAFPDRYSVIRPVIEVQLTWNKRVTQYRVLVDSGSDFCIFHADVAETLSIPVREGKRIAFYGTSGHPQFAYFHTVQIEIGGWPMDLYCGFSYDMQSLPYGLLGQTGFFDRFKIKFDYKNKRIELQSK